MSLAEFRLLYTRVLSLRHLEVRALYWPAWVQFAQWALKADKHQHKGGRGR